MDINTLIWLLPLFPLLAFFVIVLFTNRSNTLSHVIAVGAAFLSWLGSMVVFVRALQGNLPFGNSIDWLPLGPDKSTHFFIGVHVDQLTAVTLFFVAWTVLLIFIYSVGYHNFGQPKGEADHKGLPPHGAKVTDVHGHIHAVPSIEPMYARFFAFIALFAFGMYTLVVSDNLLTLFVGWEIMGLCSYLLIGFWFAKPSARAAAIKAFLTTRVGDVFMLLGIAYLYSQTGSLSYQVIFSVSTLEQLSAPAGFLGLSIAGLIGLLLFLGTIGKSAQWPLHVWLPDAMEGPTPVSAMIHAATMVSAGVYMVIRMFPLLSVGWHEGGPLTPTMTVMAIIGAGTALFAAVIAVAQNDIKRVLAYSTISQLGYMIAALGIGSYVGAAFHLVMHAFFKALLFLGSGSVIHGMEHGVLHTENHEVDPQNMFNMGGLRNKMPITFLTFTIGGLALSGFPLLTAFWSKDEILADAFGNGYWLSFLVLALAALLTAFYTARQITLTFLGEPRTREAEYAQETKWTMTLPLVVLALFSIGAGWVGIPEGLTGGAIHNWFHGFVIKTLSEEMVAQFQPLVMVISIVITVTGLSLGYWVYREVKAGQPDPLIKPLGFFYNWMRNKFYFDELYDRLFVQPAYWLADTFTNRWLDRGIIDGILHTIARVAFALGGIFRNYFDLPVVNGFGDAVGEGTKTFGNRFRAVQTGKIQQYMLSVLVFAVGILFYYLLTLIKP